MDEKEIIEQSEKFMQQLTMLAYKHNANREFNNFLDAIKENDIEQINSNKIFRIIDEVVLKNEQFVKTIPTKTVFYRAREINIEDYQNKEVGLEIDKQNITHGYNEINSKEPVLGISSGGRNNIKGSSYLYLANNEETACVEIKSKLRSLISLATFELEKDITIIDFSNEVAFNVEDNTVFNLSLGTFFTQLMMQYFVPVENEEAYKATQIISDYIRKSGIDGIAYRSFYSPGGINYTLFNSHNSIVKFKDSRIVAHQFEKHVFVDFNNKKNIETCSNDIWNYNENVVSKILKDMQDTFNK